MAERKFNLLFLRVRRRREMKLKMKIDDDVWEAVSQDRVTAILCTEELFELFLFTQYIQLSLDIRQNKY